MFVLIESVFFSRFIWHWKSWKHNSLFRNELVIIRRRFMKVRNDKMLFYLIEVEFAARIE